MNLEQRINDKDMVDYKRTKDNNTDRSDNGFNDLGIAPNLLKGITRLKFTDPTPIQKESIPIGIKGNDIIAVAQTGSGKTIAFGIPMLQRLSKMKRGTGLVLVPTRELAVQVEESLQIFSRLVNLRSAVLIGGASMTMQRVILKKNPRIIIATPGRLMDHMERRTVDLSNVEVFILDEADRMLDMGFAPDIKKIMKSIQESHQTMLFSATMPKEVEAIAATLMEAPTRIDIDRSGATPAEVSQELFFTTQQEKSRLLAVKLKECSGPVLVFTKTKRMASKLVIKVNQMGFSASEFHSDRSQGQRKRALEGFKRGRCQILIATDIAARGIDVRGIELVVNYDMPANSEDYVHRIGRTGRAGVKGHAISFVTKAQKRSIKSFERFMNIKLGISPLPSLPSEKRLIEEAEHLFEKSDYAREESAPRGRFSDDRAGRRPSPRRSDFKKPTSRRSESGSINFKRKNSNRQESGSSNYKRRDSNRPESGSSNYKRRDSNRPESRSSNFKRRESGRPETGSNKFKRKDSNRSESGQSKFQRKDSNRSESVQSNFKRKTSTDQSSGYGGYSKRKSNKQESGASLFRKKDSNRSESHRKGSKPEKVNQADSQQNNGKTENPYWLNFLKHRPSAKKKTENQGTKRKKFAKRK